MSKEHSARTAGFGSSVGEPQLSPAQPPPGPVRRPDEPAGQSPAQPPRTSLHGSRTQPIPRWCTPPSPPRMCSAPELPVGDGTSLLTTLAGSTAARSAGPSSAVERHMSGLAGRRCRSGPCTETCALHRPGNAELAASAYWHRDSVFFAWSLRSKPQPLRRAVTSSQVAVPGPTGAHSNRSATLLHCWSTRA